MDQWKLAEGWGSEGPPAQHSRFTDSQSSYKRRETVTAADPVGLWCSAGLCHIHASLGNTIIQHHIHAQHGATLTWGAEPSAISCPVDQLGSGFRRQTHFKIKFRKKLSVFTLNIDLCSLLHCIHSFLLLMDSNPQPVQAALVHTG